MGGWFIVKREDGSNSMRATVRSCHLSRDKGLGIFLKGQQKDRKLKESSSLAPYQKRPEGNLSRDVMLKT